MLCQKWPCQLPCYLSLRGQTLLSLGRFGELLSILVGTTGPDLGTHGGLGTAFSNMQDQNRVCVHTLLRSQGCRHYNENTFLCQVCTGSILGASRGAVLHVLGLPQCSWLPLKQPPLSHPHLSKDAFPSSGINLALNECRKTAH